ncbi:hypothetical protein VTH06DRAFT_1465 [Thermothelomyces fergusii]
MHLTRLHLLVTGLLSGSGLAQISAREHSRRAVNCYFHTPAWSGDTCESMASDWALTLDLFIKLNPGVTCPDLEPGKEYCVLGEWTPDPTSTSTSSPPPQTTTSQTSTSTSSSTPITSSSTPITSAAPSTTQASSTTQAPTPSVSPTMPGIDPNCNRFYKVKSGDTCDSIVSEAGITLAQLRAWNSEINDACSNLWLGYYICTGVPGAAQPSTTSTAPASAPTMPGATKDCNKWYEVSSGDTCETIAAKNAITEDQFRSWNTQINSSCNNLWLGYAVCVGVPGAAEPMPGIVAGCTRYYLVQSGDGCESVAQKNGISVQDFLRWNTYINQACTNLWANALVCVRAS